MFYHGLGSEWVVWRVLEHSVATDISLGVLAAFERTFKLCHGETHVTEGHNNLLINNKIGI